jgi:hypothetical protein
MKNLFALLVFASGLAGWYFYDQLEKLKEDLADAQRNIAAYEKTLEARRTEFQVLVGALELQKKVEFRKAEILAMKGKAEQARGDARGMQQERADVVGRLRQRWVGVLLPELVLADGRKLFNVRVSKIDESGLAVTSASGVTKLRPAELSADLRRRLYLP